METVVYQGSSLFQISIPESWNNHLDEELYVHNFYDSTENASGVLQVTAFLSNSQNFNFSEWLEEYENSIIVEINGLRFVYFERVENDHKIYNWLTGKDEVMIFLTYSIPREFDWQESKAIKDIVGSLNFK